MSRFRTALRRTRVGLRHRPILLAGAAFGVLVGGVAHALGLVAADAVLLGWCAGACACGARTFAVMRHATPAQIRRRAERLDEGEGAVLAATLAAALASLGAVAWTVASREAPLAAWETGLALLTLLVSWTFVHLLFAVRYAHEYWQAGGGLDFPGGETPDWGDFLYVALTIGMTFQTSDVAISSRLLRRLALGHALVSFLFNVVILAAAVNVAAGLID